MQTATEKGNARGYPGSPPAPRPLSDQIARADDIVSRLSRIVTRLEALTDSLHGSRPRDVSVVGSKNPTVSAQNLSSLLVDASSYITRIENELDFISTSPSS